MPGAYNVPEVPLQQQVPVDGAGAQPQGMEQNNSFSFLYNPFGAHGRRDNLDISPERRVRRERSRDRREDGESRLESRRALIHGVPHAIQHMSYVNVAVYLISNANVTREADLQQFTSALQFVHALARYLNETTIQHVITNPQIVQQATRYYTRITNILAGTTDWRTVVNLDSYVRMRSETLGLQQAWVIDEQNDDTVREMMDRIARARPGAPLVTPTYSSSSSAARGSGRGGSVSAAGRNSGGNTSRSTLACYRYNGENPETKEWVRQHFCTDPKCRFRHACTTCGALGHARFQRDECCKGTPPRGNGPSNSSA